MIGPQGSETTKERMRQSDDIGTLRIADVQLSDVNVHSQVSAQCLDVARLK
jgi:hypothetical protein